MAKKEYKETIKFVHGNGGDVYIFKTEPNPLNSNQMWWFEPQHYMYTGDVRGAKAIAKNIRKNCVVLE
jgi:hypothetical protein